MSRAFSLPHVVVSICDNLPLQGLTEIALINREFCEVVTKRLWEHVRYSARLKQALRALAPAHQQQHVSMVRSLVLNGSFMGLRNGVTGDDDGLVFDRLQHLRIQGYNHNNHHLERLAPYVVPGALRSLTLDLTYASPSLLDFLAPRCSELRELRLEWAKELDASELAQFVVACPSLDVIHWNRDRWPVRSRYDLVATPGWGDINGRVDLRRLELPMDEAVLMEGFDKIDTHWPFEVTIEVALSSRAISLISMLDTNTHSIALYLPDLKSQILKPLLQLQSLQSLVLKLPDNSGALLHEPEMMSLSSLSQLTRLVITSESNRVSTQNQASLELSVDQLIAWISCFPKLKVLSLNVAMPNDYEEALVALGTRCPQLERCFWPGRINFSVLQLDSREDCLFPSMSNFSCGRALKTSLCPDKFPRNLSKADLAVVLRRHFPQAYIVHFFKMRDDKGAQAIRRAFRSVGVSSRLR